MSLITGSFGTIEQYGDSNINKITDHPYLQETKKICTLGNYLSSHDILISIKERYISLYMKSNS